MLNFFVGCASLILLTPIFSQGVVDDSILPSEIIEENNVVVKAPSVISSDDEVVTYFENVEQEVDKALDEPLTDTVKTKLKNTFITLVDFLFYDEPIGGKTFNELTDSAKMKILDIFDRIDNKIDSKWPGYKETVKDKGSKVYSNIKSKVKEGINILKDKIHNAASDDTYNSFQDDYNNLKDKTGDALEIIKDITKDTGSKIKDWYENFRNQP